MSYEALDVGRGRVLSLYKALLREGRKFPIYNRRRFVDVKTKTDFLTYREETDTDIIKRQVQLAEDMLDSLLVMGESQRSFFAWEEDPILGPTPEGKPQRRQPPPRIATTTPEEPKAPQSNLHQDDF